MFKSRNTNTAQQCSVSRSLLYFVVRCISPVPFFTRRTSVVFVGTLPSEPKSSHTPLLKNEITRHLLLIVCIIACRRVRGTDVLLRSLRSHAKSFKTEPAEEMHWRLGRRLRGKTRDPNAHTVRAKCDEKCINVT